MLFERGSRRICDGWVRTGIVKEEDRPLYEYGLQQGAMILLNLCSVLAIGALMGMIWYSVFFTVCYMLLRTYVGGYHARSQAACYFGSVILQSGALALSGALKLPGELMLLLMGGHGAVILWLTPGESKNKPLSDKERRIFAALGRGIWILQFVFAAVLFSFGRVQAANCLVINSVLVCDLLLLHHFQNRFDS